MFHSKITNLELTEDGHPCEAALEFRRIAVTKQIVEDISINSLDLAISFAWTGKAISRSNKLAAWQQIGVDANTWEMIRAMAIDTEIRRFALHDALHASSATSYSTTLDLIRRSSAFNRAMTSVQSTLSVTSNQEDVLFWMGELAHIAKQIPGPPMKPFITKADNLVHLASFRKSKADT
jgi:hypothetical protein